MRRMVLGDIFHSDGYFWVTFLASIETPRWL
jgi:hypothetical protein